VMFKKSSFKGPWLELAFANNFGFRLRFGLGLERRIA